MKAKKVLARLKNELAWAALGLDLRGFTEPSPLTSEQRSHANGFQLALVRVQKRIAALEVDEIDG